MVTFRSTVVYNLPPAARPRPPPRRGALPPPAAAPPHPAGPAAAAGEDPQAKRRRGRQPKAAVAGDATAAACQVEGIASCLGPSTVVITITLNAAECPKLFFAAVAGDQVVF
jgi:hypothetical protein